MSHHLSLRAWLPTDAAAISRGIGHQAVLQCLDPSIPTPYTEDHAREFITLCSETDLPQWAICLNHEVVGGIGLHDELEQGLYSLGYWLAQPHWRKGIMSWAIHAAIEQLRAHYPQVRRLQASVYQFNEPSELLLKKLDFVFFKKGAISCKESCKPDSVNVFCKEL